MNWADWAIIAVLGLSVWIGAARGFVREALSLAIWVAAFGIATVSYEAVAGFFTTLIETPSLRLAIAWLALFVAVLLVGALVAALFGRLVEATGLTGTDRLLGTLFGALRGVAIVMLVLIFLPKLLPVNQDPWWQQSALIPHFLRFEGTARQLAGASFEFFKKLF